MCEGNRGSLGRPPPPSTRALGCLRHYEERAWSPGPGIPARVYCPGPGHAAARVRGDRSLGPKRRLSEDGRRRPAGLGHAAQGLGAFSWGPHLPARGAERLGDFAGGRERLGLN